MSGRRLGWRVFITTLAGFVVAVLSAVTIALLDLYLVGHGRTGLLRESISWSQADISLSIGDTAMLALTVLAAALTWQATGRPGRQG